MVFRATRLSPAPATFAASFSLAVTLLSTSACNGITEFGSNKDSPRDKGGDSDKGDDEGPGDQPAEVAGAFLTCSYLTDDGESAEGEFSPIGCAVFEDDQKQAADERTYKLTLADGLGADADLKTTAAGSDSDWHVLARFPNALAKDGMLTMKVTGKDEPKTYDLAAKDIGATKLLGSSVPVGGDEGVDGEKPEVASLSLTSVPVHAVWKAGVLGLSAGGIKADDFCDANGPKPAFDGLSAGIMSFVDLLSEGAGSQIVSDKIEKISQTFDVSSSSCFHSFKLVLGSGDDSGKYAHEDAGGHCLFVSSDLEGVRSIFIIDRKKLSAAESESIQVESLRDFAHAQACD